MSPEQEKELFNRLFALEAYSTVLGAYVNMTSPAPEGLKMALEIGLEQVISQP